MANELEQTVLKKAQAWLDGHYDEETKKQVKYLMENDMKEQGHGRSGDERAESIRGNRKSS